MNLEEDAFAERLYQGERIGSSAPPKFYDVFINHRGPDVKKTLALQLYKSLEEVGIRTFLDCKEMELGDLFPSTIQNAIYSASVQIAIFSATYAQSVWCLAELALMLKTKRRIIPIFYDVPPCDLRFVEKGVYADSFKYHTQKRRHLDKLDAWKEALHCVSFISGYEFSPENDNLETLCKFIVSTVQREVKRTRNLEIAKFPTAIEKWVEDFERTCSNNKAIGIYGQGGSGKSTLAKALFNQWRPKFTASSFLFDVRESSLVSLQAKLVKDLVQEKQKFDSVPEGYSHLRSRLVCNPSVSFLIVMDDVDDEDQLNALLVRDLLLNSSGSLIIVTTRDHRVLIRADINCRYKMKEMNVQQGTELFCWHAFHQPYPTSGYEDLVESFVKECGGLPLSLKVLGGHVFGCASMHYWELELGKVRKTSLPEGIKEKLRISLDSLDDEQMQAFLDIACFFVNKPSDMALRILEASGWSAGHTLQVLMDKCLVEVQMGRTYWGGFDSQSAPLLTMHDHIRDVGRELADNEMSISHRVWRPEHLRPQVSQFKYALAAMRGHNFRCLNSIFDQHGRFELRYFIGNSNDSKNPTSLLWLELDSSLADENIETEVMSTASRLDTILSWIPLQSLQCLKISNGCFQRLWQRDQQAPSQLKDLILDGVNLDEFPNSLGMLSQLENLVLAEREKWNGTEWNSSMRIQGSFLSESLANLANLRSLVLRDFTLIGKLSFKSIIYSTITETTVVSRLGKIDMRDVKQISKVSISGQCLPSLKFLHLERNESLIELDLGCSTCQCCLETITVDGCWKLQKIKGMRDLHGLKYLHLSAPIIAVWRCIKVLQQLPTQVTSLIWKSKACVGSILQQFNVVSSLIGLDGTVTEIPMDLAKLVIPLTEQPCAIMIFMLVESFYEGTDCRKYLKIPPMNSMAAYIGKGKYIVAVVVTEPEKIIKMQYGMSSWIPTVSNGRIETGFVVTIQHRGKWKTLPLLEDLCYQDANSCTQVGHFSMRDSIFKPKCLLPKLKND